MGLTLALAMFWGAALDSNGLFFMKLPQGFRTVEYTSWHSCGCVTVALGQGHAYLPCAKHEPLVQKAIEAP